MSAGLYGIARIVPPAVDAGKRGDMSDDADLARRAVACTRWVWCEGLHLTSGHVYLGQDADGEEFYVDGG